MRITLTMYESTYYSKNSGPAVVTAYRVDPIPSAETIFVSNFAAPAGARWQWCVDGYIDDSGYSKAAAALTALQGYVDAKPS